MKFSIIAIVFLLFAGCSTRQNIQSDSDRSPDSEARIRGAQAKDSQVLAASAEIQRILQYSATVSMETDSPDSLHKHVLELAIRFNGYLLNSQSAETTVRVPSPSFNQFLEALEPLGTILSKDIQGQDVSDEYYDLRTRLDNAERTRQRYLELLNKANTVESALPIERELERLSRDIDLLNGRMNKIKHLADYSTITVTTKAPPRPGPLGYVFVGLYKAIEWLFVWR